MTLLDRYDWGNLPTPCRELRGGLAVVTRQLMDQVHSWEDVVVLCYAYSDDYTEEVHYWKPIAGGDPLPKAAWAHGPAKCLR